MKKIGSILLLLVLLLSILSGCGTQQEELVSKQAFPIFSEVDMDGRSVSNEVFSKYDATIVNFWSNGCGSCIEEMPELEELYQKLQGQNINLIGVGSDSGLGEEQHTAAKEILNKKGVTYLNISPAKENSFYTAFISEITTYPSTYIVDREGNIIGAPIVGNVKNQIDTLAKRLETILDKQIEL